MTSFVQPLGDELRRVDIAHATATNEGWVVDGAYTFFEGRIFPVGARGEHVSNEWAVTTVWGQEERGQAESFLNLLRDVAQETDARLDLHLDAPPTGGTAIDLVVETHEVPQQLTPGVTSIVVVFRQVDAG